MVLGYMELPEDEVPPEEIWHHGARLEEWFAAVQQRRRTGMTRIDDDDEDVPMTRNALTERLLGNA